MKCEACGHEQPQGKFCSQCGGSLREGHQVDVKGAAESTVVTATTDTSVEGTAASVTPIVESEGSKVAPSPESSVPPAPPIPPVKPASSEAPPVPLAPVAKEQNEVAPPVPPVKPGSSTEASKGVVPPVPPAPPMNRVGGAQGVQGPTLQTTQSAGQPNSQGLPGQVNPQGAQPYTPVAPGRKLYERNDKVHIIAAIILSLVLWGTSWMLMFSNIMNMASDFEESYEVYNGYTYEDEDDSPSHKRDSLKSEPRGKTATPTPVQTATPAPKPDPAKVDAESAQRSFNQYHQYITARNYTAAYNQFTDQFKNQAGDVNAWASGFATTKESVVDSMNVVSQNNNQIILNFVLHATDYEGNGTVKRSFSGQATMVKVNNRWLIDSIEARQL